MGLDPWHGPIHEAKKHGAYRALVEADGARSPFPNNYFASGFSNSVLEHIPHVDAVLGRDRACVKAGRAVLFLRAQRTLFFRAFDLAHAWQRLYRMVQKSYARLFMPICRMFGKSD